MTITIYIFFVQGTFIAEPCVAGVDSRDIALAGVHVRDRRDEPGDEAESPQGSCAGLRKEVANSRIPIYNIVFNKDHFFFGFLMSSSGCCFEETVDSLLLYETRSRPMCFLLSQRTPELPHPAQHPHL